MKKFNPITLVRNAPWVVMAVLLHLILVVVAGLFYVAHQERKAREEATQIAVSKPPAEPLEEINLPPEVIDRKAIPKNEEAEIVAFEDDIYIPTTEAMPEDLHMERGDPTALDNLPSGGTTGGTAIGVGEGGFHGLGKPSAFGGRKPGTGARKGRAGGPTQGTEKAVLDGLRWLVRHQNPDGSWGADTLKQRCVSDAPCYDPKVNLTDHYNEGLTGLALLCFLGAGFSHESKQDIVDTAMAKRYKVGEVIKKGLEWLRKKQNPDGAFSETRYAYSEILATLAMTEAYGLTQNRYWRDPAQKGIDFLQNAQRPNPSGQGFWGWRYLPRQDIEDFRRGTGDEAYKKELFDSDTSVTAWAVMALKSAQISGLQVKQESMDGAMEFCKFVTADNGLVGYLDAKTAGATVQGTNDHFIYHPTTMSALGMCIRIFAQRNPDDPFLDLAAKRIIADLPTISKDRLSIDYYYWYYASLALNQIDGPDSPRKSGKYWGPWNKAMVDAVLALQDQTDRACTSGGWIIGDRWAYTGGPLYGTAINVLTLEVYYRYENAFGGFKRN